MKLLDETIALTPIARPIPTDERPRGICLDRGYDYEITRESVIAQRFTPHIRARGQDTPNQLRDPTGNPGAGSSRPATRGRTATGRC